MSERIRYIKQGNGLLRSTQVFEHPTNGARYIVQLNVAENQFMVLDEVSELIASSGRHTSLAMLKKQARASLEALGVELSRGKRQRLELSLNGNNQE